MRGENGMNVSKMQRKRKGNAVDGGFRFSITVVREQTEPEIEAVAQILMSWWLKELFEPNTPDGDDAEHNSSRKVNQ